MNKLLLILALTLVSFSVFPELAQNQVFLPDSVAKTVNLQAKDTLAVQMDTVVKVDPNKVVWMGAIIPGYGQILNRKYWKLPVVYAGFLACSYAITWNSVRYSAYKQAYVDITDDNSATESYLEIIPEGFTLESYGGEAAFTTLLKSGMDQSRYNRDLSVIVSVAYYALTLVDAYVDAQLSDFDISPDLSMKIRPALIQERYLTGNAQNKSFGFHCKISF